MSSTSNDGKTLDSDDPPDASANNSLDSAASIQPTPAGYSMHMYPFPSHILPQQQPPRSKRRQVKNACTNCQKACKKCDDARPCLRCVKYGISEECIDSQRKERKKGVKRGPYKKRDGKASNVERPHVSPSDAAVAPSGPPPVGGTPIMGPFMPMPGYFGQYPQPPFMKPMENGQFYTQYMPVPHPMQLAHGGPEAEHSNYPPQQYYPAFMPFGPPSVYPYVVQRHDTQAPANYMAFTMYPKVSSTNDLASGGQGREEASSSSASEKVG